MLVEQHRAVGAEDLFGLATHLLYPVPLTFGELGAVDEDKQSLPCPGRIAAGR